jgi:hypothetical protein
VPFAERSQKNGKCGEKILKFRIRSHDHELRRQRCEHFQQNNLCSVFYLVKYSSALKKEHVLTTTPVVGWCVVNNKRKYFLKNAPCM